MKNRVRSNGTWRGTRYIFLVRIVKESIVDKKTEEMIALGVSYGINCTACMEYHKKAAIGAGLTEAEMREAIRVGRQVKAGAAKKTEAVAKDLFEEVDDGACCTSGRECCP
jgi:AhpD family alkylhydroperoxidase